MKLTLNKETLQNLRKIGIQGLGIIEFDENLGPIPKFVYSRHARLIRRILRDQFFSSKISILAKYAKEAITTDNSRMIIETFESVGNRRKTNYIIVQASTEANYWAIRSFLKNLKRHLNGTSNLQKEKIEKLILNAL